MELLVTFNKYKSVLNLDENLTEPENFQVKQWQAMDYIYRNISQIHLFPVSKSMYARMKPAYKRQFETALCEQIKYMINNASIFDDPASVIVSSSIGNYSHGPMGDKSLAGFIKLLAPITDNLLTALGWRYMSIDDKLPFEDYYDVGYDEFFLRSISKDATNHIITIFDNNGTPTSFGYADLPPYEAGKFLHVNATTGELEWTDVATPILENFYTKAESDAKFVSKTDADAKYSTKTELNSEAETRQSADNDLKNQIEEKSKVVIHENPSVGSEVAKSIEVDGTVWNFPEGGSVPTNVVTTDTDQTIQATKTLKSKIIGSSIQPYFLFTNDSGQDYGNLGQGDITLSNGNSGSFYKATTYGYNHIQTSDSTADYTFTFPSKTGTFALTSDIPSVENKMDLLGSVPGHTDLPYNLPYFFETAPTADNIKVTAKTISLDNKKTQGEYSMDIVGATTTTAGLMTAEDKTKLGNAQTKVKYSATEPTGSEDGDIWIY